MKELTSIKEKIEISQTGSILTRELKDLGFSDYEIKKLVDRDVLSKKDRGIYVLGTQFNNALASKEKTSNGETQVEEVQANQEVVPKKMIESELDNLSIPQLYSRANARVRNNPKEAIKCYERILSLNPNESYARFGLFAALVFDAEYEKAYEALQECEGVDNGPQDNYVYYTLMLSDLIAVPKDIVNECEEKLKEIIKINKKNDNMGKFRRSLAAKDYDGILKYINFCIKLNVERKKWYLSTNILQALAYALAQKYDVEYLKTKPAPKVEEVKPQVTPKVEQPKVVEPQTPESKKIVVVPKVEESLIISNNLLLEAINSGNYLKAYILLENNQIEDPIAIIKVLLEKLSSMSTSLVASPSPVKVVAEEQVIVVDTPVKEEKIEAEEVVDNSVGENLVETPTTEVVEPEKATEAVVPKQVETRVVEQTTTHSVSKQKQDELSPEELIDIAYKAYSSSLENADFMEATRNLARYSFLINTNGKYRDITFHHERIAIYKIESLKSMETYKEKIGILKKLWSLLSANNKEQAENLLEQYKELNGAPVYIRIAEGYLLVLASNYRGAINKLERLISECHEPVLFEALAKAYMGLGEYNKTLEYCVKYNQARPNSTARIYMLMADCYNRLHKPAKAAKALKKADEINKKNNKRIDLSGKIQDAESRADKATQIRLALLNGNEVD